MEVERKPVYQNVELIIDKSPLSPFEGEFRYFEYSQNNSGGNFHYDENLGEFVVIAAQNSDQADERALSIGIYFNGVDQGYDCECCGDRWSSAYGKGDDVPLIYGSRPEVVIGNGGFFRDKIVVHHADGTRETYQRFEAKK